MTSREFTATEQTRRDWTIRLGIALLAAVIVALLGPFSTYERFTVVERLVYWGGLIFVLIWPAVVVRTWVLRLLKGPPLRLDIIAAVAIALLFAPPIWAFNVFVMRFDVHRPTALAEHLVISLLICFVPVALRHYLRVVRTETMAAGEIDQGAAPSTVEDPAFLRRLDPDKRGDIWHVSADDHQLAVYTSAGESRIRMRFSDALHELEELDGIKVHRSHWVAYSAIRSVVQEGRRHKIVLQCGTEIPVSQNRADALRQAGFLAD